MANSNKDLLTKSLSKKARFSPRSKKRYWVHLCLLLLIIILQIINLRQVFIEVDYSTYMRARGEIFVSPNWRYGFATGLGGVTWIRRLNTEQLPLLYFQVSALKNIYFLNLIGKFLIELILYVSILTFIFWDNFSSNKLGRNFGYFFNSFRAKILASWVMLSIPLVIFQYGTFNLVSGIPESFNAYEYYDYSTISYRGIVDIVYFVPYTISRWIGVNDEVLNNPIVVFLLSAIFLVFVSLLIEFLTKRFSHAMDGSA
ncbi:hypothetical protein [Candidatus Leptofilum sp.]|uniref:hypothetical protein n=1 Tax=Candidatus Leptofilum sp. TaxID=3241576 RepID=UPI003B59A539